MSWSYKRDYWGRFQVLSDEAPHADTRSQGIRTFNSPDAYSGTVATLDSQQSGYPVMAIAELIVSTANYRGQSAEEWLELNRALKAVPRDPWKAQMGEWSKSADLRTRNGDGITFCRVIKADHTDVEAETKFIVNVRDTARDLLDRSFDQCFTTHKTRDGTTFRLDAEDGDLVETYGPFTLSPTREVMCKGGTPCGPLGELPPLPRSGRLPGSRPDEPVPNQPSGERSIAARDPSLAPRYRVQDQPY